MADTAQERKRLEEAEGLVNALVSALESAHGVSGTKWTRDVEEAYVDILCRLRARQREDEDGLERIEARLDELEGYGISNAYVAIEGEARQGGFLQALRMVRQELDAMDTEPPAEREPDIVFDGEDFIWPCGCRWSIPGDGWEWCDDHPRGRYCLRNDHGE